MNSFPFTFKFLLFSRKWKRHRIIIYTHPSPFFSMCQKTGGPLSTTAGYGEDRIITESRRSLLCPLFTCRVTEYDFLIEANEVIANAVGRSRSWDERDQQDMVTMTHSPCRVRKIFPIFRREHHPSPQRWHHIRTLEGGGEGWRCLFGKLW